MLIIICDRLLIINLKGISNCSSKVNATYFLFLEIEKRERNVIFKRKNNGDMWDMTVSLADIKRIAMIYHRYYYQIVDLLGA